MMNKIPHILIVNIGPLLAKIKPEISKVFEENNYNKNHIPPCVTWCIDEALFNVLLLCMQPKIRPDEFQVVYSRISYILETHIKAFVSFQDTCIFNDNSVSTFYDGSDLYIKSNHDF